MDIYLIYLIKMLLLPLASLLLLALCAVFYIKQRTFPVWVIAFSVISLLGLSLPVVSGFLASIQEQHPPLDEKILTKNTAQAIVVLGGGLRDPAPEYPSQVTVKTMTMERLRYAAYLAKKSQIAVLVTGGKVFNKNKFSEAEIMSRVMHGELGVVVKWQEDKSRNTAENALYSAKMLKAEGIKQIVLITHAFHMKRALTQFKLQGLEVLPAPTGFISSSKPAVFFDFLPTVRALQKSTLIIHEMIGQCWYSIRY